MKLHVYFLILMVIISSACQKLEAPASSHINGYEFTPKGEEQIVKNSDGSLSGSGTIIFRKPLGPTDSANRITVKFFLDEGGKLNAILKSNEDLGSGLSLELSRLRNELVASLGYSDTAENVDVTPYLKKRVFPQTQDSLELVIDVISLKKARLRVLIYEGAVTQESIPSFDSNKVARIENFAGGQFWGMILSHAKVVSVSAEPLPDYVTSQYSLF